MSLLFGPLYILWFAVSSLEAEIRKERARADEYQNKYLNTAHSTPQKSPVQPHYTGSPAGDLRYAKVGVEIAISRLMTIVSRCDMTGCPAALRGAFEHVSAREK